MLRIVLSAIVLMLAQTVPLASAASCSGADPAIVSASAHLVGSSGSSNRYRIKIMVANLGNRGQASNVLQFVDIYEEDMKLDARGVPPLHAGEGHQVTYDYLRATDAGDGTAHFIFRLNMTQPAGMSSQNCSTANDTFRLVL